MIFQIIGKPQGKARPRFDGRHKRTFTPSATADYEKRIRQAYIAAGGGIISETAPIAITIMAFYEKAQSCKKEMPTMKPDWDNIGKAVCDALNGIAYKDDSQVVSANVYKVWASDGLPKVVVNIGVFEDEQLF